jgi:outer membrane protein OmpA-like peptidoglycan-associated protein
MKCKIYTLRMIVIISTITILFMSCASNRKVDCTWVNPLDYAYSKLSITLQFAKATITGVVVDKDGIPIDNAAISFDGSAVGNTNTTGNFSFEIEKNINYNYQLVVQKEGLNNSVRTYHTQMGNAAYTIQMAKPCPCNSSKDYCQLKHSFNFTENSDDISTENKELLNQIVDCLKQHPEMEISIINNLMDANKSLARDRLQTVVRYFVSKGVSENRISKKSQRAVAGNANDIDIIPNKQ